MVQSLVIDILAWLIVRPSRWRDYCATLGLSANFTLSELPLLAWQRTDVQQFLRLILLIYPLLTSSVTIGILWIIGKPALSLLLAAVFAWVICHLLTLICALTISAAFAIPIGILGGLSIGLAFGDMGALWSFIGTLLAIGVASHIFYSIQSEQIRPPLKSFSYVIMGGAFSLLLLISGGFLGWLAGNILKQNTEVLVIFILGGIFIIQMLCVLWFLYRHWQGGKIIGWVLIGWLMSWLITALYGLSIDDDSSEFLQYITTGLYRGAIHAILLGGLFASSYKLVERFSDPLSAIQASILSAGSFYAIRLIFMENYPSDLTLAGGLLGFLVGFYFYLWRYPFELIFAAWLIKNNHPLSWHPACWDESQQLPLYGLDDWLVRCYQHSPEETEKVFETLAVGHQRWAVQQAQLKLDIQRLEQCHQLSDIAKIKDQVSVTDVSSLLYSFKQLSEDLSVVLYQQNAYYQRITLKNSLEKLAHLWRELLRSTEGALFLKAARHWQTILEKTLEQVSVQQQQTIFDPYYSGNPLPYQNLTFVGRYEVALALETLLYKESCPPILLYGQRRMGKTSLLLNLPRLLSHQIMPFFIDIQGLAQFSSNPTEFFYALYKEMSRSVKIYKFNELPTLTFEQLNHNPFSAFDTWLEQVIQHIAPAQLLLMLDEFIALEKKFAQQILDREEILGFLRHQMQHRRGLKIILAGSLLPEEIPQWATYLVNVRTIKVDCLKKDEVYQLVEQPMPEFNLRYHPLATQRIWTLTHGHPDLTQALCSSLVELKNTQPIEQRFYAQLKDVEQAVSPTLRNKQMFFNEILHIEGIEILRFLAKHGENAVLEESCLMAQYPQPNALARLLRRDLIEKTSQGYCFQVELIRRAVLLEKTM